MKFCDEVTVTLKAGNGGGGAVSFRREKFIAKGGPDGGDGGRGGNIILRTNSNLNTLVEFNTRKDFKAPDGGHGAKRNCRGKDGESLILEVPLGTIVKNGDGTEILADLKYRDQEYIVARGGIGGKGNANFVSSTRQTPRFAELGEPGEEVVVHLELKLVAEVGIIGMPSAGKSTLISHVSAVKPKIAEYHFTTLKPNLGVVDMTKWHGDKDSNFTIVDIPGLIEGASEGKGLGHEFLRHVGRAKFLIHLLDGSLKNIRGNFDTINQELKQYSQELAEKEQVVVINKTDILIPEIYPEIQEGFKEYCSQNKKQNRLFFISSVTGEGLKELMFYIWNKVQQMRKNDQEVIEMRGIKDPTHPENQEETEHKIFRPHLSHEKNFTVELIDREKVRTELEEKGHRLTRKERIQKKEWRDMIKTGEMNQEEYDKKMYEMKYGFKEEEKIKHFVRQVFQVSGQRINQIVIMTDINNEEAVDRVHDVMKKHKIYNKLSKEGAVSGDVIIIAGKRFYYRD